MKLDSLPGFVAVKLLQLEERASHLQAEADRAAEGIARAQSLIRDPGRMTQRQLADTQAAWKTATEAQPGRVHQASAARDTIAVCRRWLAALPENTVLQPREVDVDGRSLADVRARLEDCAAELKRLRAVPTPSPDIEQRIRHYVTSLARPTVSGIETGKQLRIEWPAEPIALAALVAPDMVEAAILLSVERLANEPLPPPQRQLRIAALVKEQQQLLYAEEVLTTDRDERNMGSPGWAILGAAVVVAREEKAA